MARTSEFYEGMIAGAREVCIACFMGDAAERSESGDWVHFFGTGNQATCLAGAIHEAMRVGLRRRTEPIYPDVEYILARMRSTAHVPPPEDLTTRKAD